MLSHGSPGFDLSKHEKEKSLIFIDSLEEYFGKRPGLSFKMNLANHAKKIGKNGLSVLGDLGAYPYKSKWKELVDYELSLPRKYDLPMKEFCLYHKKDFESFSDEQKQKLIAHHGKAINILGEEKALASVFFEQPLNFVHNIKRGRHIVLFYEEAEYAKLISFQFIKSGLEHKKVCCYISEDDLEVVKKEMTDNGIDVNKFIMNGLLYCYEVSSLTDYHQRDLHTDESGLEDTLNFTKLAQTERLVLRYPYNINPRDQIKSILEWEHKYRLKYLKNGTTTLLCAYPVDNIIPIISNSIGTYAKWMNHLLTMYEGVIFARKFLKGVAFNLN